MFDNEYWLLEAQNILRDAKHSLCRSPSAPDQPREVVRWSILHCCAVMRAGALLGGTHRTSSLLKSLSLEQPNVKLPNLEEDLGFSWFLTSSTKRLMSEVLMAKWELSRVKNPLCSIILRQTVDSFQSGTPSSRSFRKSLIGDLADLQADMEEWRAGYDVLLHTVGKLSWEDEASCPILVQYADLMLCYE
jgi:hypothetical protein